MEQKSPTIHENKGLTIEEVMALYFNVDAIQEQPKMIYMLKNGSMKFYYTWDDEAFKPNYYMSVSTLIQRTMPMPYEIVEWYAKLGLRAAEEKLSERSSYGMLMDGEFGNFLISKKCNLDTIRDRVHAFVTENKCDLALVDKWTEELSKDMLSFNQWIIDYDVEPISLQIMLASDELQMAGRLDLVCMKNKDKYTDKTPTKDRKRVRALVDYKSGKSGFHESNEIQLKIYESLWNDNFPNYPIEQLGNYSGKDWLKGPTYNFKDQTECDSHRKIDHLIEIARVDELDSPSRIVKVMGGELVFKGDIEANLTAYNSDEYIINIHRQRL